MSYVLGLCFVLLDTSARALTRGQKVSSVLEDTTHPFNTTLNLYLTNQWHTFAALLVVCDHSLFYVLGKPRLDNGAFFVPIRTPLGAGSVLKDTTRKVSEEIVVSHRKANTDEMNAPCERDLLGHLLDLILGHKGGHCCAHDGR